MILSAQTSQDTPVSIALPFGVNGQGVWACDHGTVTPAPDGTVRYVPNPGYIGPDRCVTTTVAAPGIATTPVTINISVLPGQTPGLPNTGGGGGARGWSHARALMLLVLVALLGGTIAASGLRQRRRR